MEQKRETVLEWYRKNHEYVDAPCGGSGDCGRCKIQFLSEAPEAGEKEKARLSKEELEQGIRLACMTEMATQMKSTDFVPVGDIFSEEEQILFEEYEREADCVSEQGFGIALDIGTTTIAMRLVGMNTKQCLATVTGINHQRAYGADVLTRIKAANEGKSKELQQCIRRDIFGLMVHLLTKTGVSPSLVKKIVVVGNTTMCHLLLGYSCEGLGEAPFSPVDIGFIHTTTDELFEDVEAYGGCRDEFTMPDIDIVILPGISAFVGADIVAGMYYCDMDLKEKPHMLLDVGTNGEMVIGDKDGFVVTSAAAGPVFEGGNISCGMPAVKGAIAHIKEDICEVVGGVEPKGICGSGLVDLTAYLLDKQVIDENGTLCDDYFDTGYPVGLALKKELPYMRLTQSDIRQLQMGKAAIRAGIDVLTKDCAPEKIYLAGGFGVALDVESAVKIDLLAASPARRIQSAGNTALEGAQKFLFDEQGEERVTRIVEKSREILLAKQGNFEEKYIHFMQFLI